MGLVFWSVFLDSSRNLINTPGINPSGIVYLGCAFYDSSTHKCGMRSCSKAAKAGINLMVVQSFEVRPGTRGFTVRSKPVSFL